jgi:multiple sugar transport system permease protein
MVFRRLAIPIALVIALAYISPLLYVLLSSFKPGEAILLPPLAGFTPTLSSYAKVFGDVSFMHNLLNSVIVTTGTTVATLLLGSAVAYAVTRLGIGHWMSRGALVARMVPPITLILPFFLVYREADLLDMRIGLIAAYTAFNLPMVIWLLIGFFDAIDRDYDNAARIDGASIVQIIRHVLWPLARSGVAATALLTAIYAWNEFLLALVLTTSAAQTAPVGMTRYVSERSIDWGALGAAGVVISLPVAVFALAMHRHLVQGLSAGQLK